MKRTSTLLFFLMIFFSACTQTRNVRKAYAFVQHITYGTIATDDNGNQLTPGAKTIHFIYLESKRNAQPAIAEINANGKIIKNPVAVAVPNNQLPVTLTNKDGNKVLLTPYKGNSLWKIEFESTGNTNTNKQIIANEPVKEKIIIKEIRNRRTFLLTVYTTELQPVMGL